MQSLGTIKCFSSLIYVLYGKIFNHNSKKGEDNYFFPRIKKGGRVNQVGITHSTVLSTHCCKHFEIESIGRRGVLNQFHVLITLLPLFMLLFRTTRMCLLKLDHYFPILIQKKHISLLLNARSRQIIHVSYMIDSINDIYSSINQRNSLFFS